MHLDGRSRRLLTSLIPIPIAAGLAALFLLAGCGGSAAGDTSSEDDLGATTTIRVHHPAQAMELRGNGGSLSWSAGVRMKAAADDTWTYTTRALKKRTEFKPMVEGRTWSRGPNYAVEPGATLDVWPRFGGDAGRVERVDGWWSNGLQNSRPIWIYYPASYDEQPRERFPVIYMHDGQNLFDPAYAFGGSTWHVADAMNDGVASGAVREAIVVGIGNTQDRIWEYTPTDGGYGGGGAQAYVDFVVNELKPQVDLHLRTSPGRLDTAILGSSLGGLVSAYAGLAAPGTFGLVGAMSPSTWWDGAWILGAVRGASGKPARVYVDSGDAGAQDGEPGDDMLNTQRLAQAYRDAGNIEVGYLVGHGDSHTESAWARRLPGALRYLLGPRPALP